VERIHVTQDRRRAVVTVVMNLPSVKLFVSIRTGSGVCLRKFIKFCSLCDKAKNKQINRLYVILSLTWNRERTLYFFFRV
jgi:hypothetical protein